MAFFAFKGQMKLLIALILLLASHVEAQVVSFPPGNVASKVPFCSDGGANDTYTCEILELAGLVDGQLIELKPNTSNTGAATVNINGLGATTITQADGSTALSNNDLVAGQRYLLSYDGSVFRLVTSAGTVTADSVGATEIDETDDYTWTGDHDFTGATVTGLVVTEAQDLDDVFDLGQEIDGANSSANAFKVGNGTVKWYIYHDAVSGLLIQCFVTTLNNCSYYTVLNDDKFWGAKNSAGTVIFEVDETNGTTRLIAGTQAQGDILYFNGTIWTRLAPGTSGQVLQTQGAGANPQWAARQADVVRLGATDASANDTEYLNYSASFGSAAIDSASALNARAMVGITGTVAEMSCRVDTAPTSTNTVTFTVVTGDDVNDSLADSSMTLQFTGTTVNGSTTTNPVSVTEGQYVGIKKVDSASATASGATTCFLRIEG